MAEFADKSETEYMLKLQLEQPYLQSSFILLHICLQLLFSLEILE